MEIEFCMTNEQMRYMANKHHEIKGFVALLIILEFSNDPFLNRMLIMFPNVKNAKANNAMSQQ